MKEIKLKIEGMHCTGCSNRLEKELNNTNVIGKAEVNFEQKEATITYNESQTNIDKIKEAIQDAGFRGE